MIAARWLTSPPAAALESELKAHDDAVRALGVEVWLGAEPTFTRADSQDAQWLYAAEGGDKEPRARALLEALGPRLGTQVRLCRATGRHFPGEEAPRFAFGAAWRRDGGGLAPWTDAPLELDAAPAPAPPPDPALAWLTVTPDPGVVEVNQAPAEDLARFAGWSYAVEEAATLAGLSAVRFRYNGDAVDSGGGGQLTLGGPTAARSPFFVRPRLLPSLLRFFNRHPCLSYWFAMECIGSASQGPRPDEGVRERFGELAVTLDRLDTVGEAASPELLWESLAPVLVDSAGNSHRAELNVEKLCNPHLPDRGRLGLVEFRALRMEPTPARRIAVAALWRALAAYLARHPCREPLIDWGPALHDRFALPHFLQRDLDAVLGELDAHGLAPGPTLRSLLCAPPEPVATLRHARAELHVTPARDFWPLVGDVASQERSGSRVVDSSLRRVEVCVRSPHDEPPGEVSVGGWALPLVAAGRDGTADLWLAAVRYRSFLPKPGFLPDLLPHDPLTLCWSRHGAAQTLALHGWKPAGGGYDGLPKNAQEAAERRAERVVVREAESAVAPRPLPLSAQPQGYTLDLRRLP